ncbi:MAG TPA: hypothetical protein DDX92_11975 [Flavobacteriales bacterium]|nr:hypothetical protein [Flavobacteriales bacterium]
MGITIQDILKNIEGFYKRYYLNLLIRGLLLSSGLLISWFIVVNTAEFLGNFNGVVRFMIYYGTISLALLVLGFWVVIPTLKLLKIKEGLSQEDCAIFIGNHYKNIGDKLLNTIQLSLDREKNELNKAALDQKINQIAGYDFSGAVQFRKNKKWLPYFVIPFGVLFTLIVLSPDLIIKSSKRIIEYGIPYHEMAPFDFVFESDEYWVKEGQDVLVKVDFKGDQLPEQSSIVLSDRYYRMQGSGLGKFIYKIRNVKNDMEFRIKAGKYFSKVVPIKVYPQPKVESLQLILNYPDYLNKRLDTIEVIDKVEVPEGTALKWRIETSKTESVMFLEDSNSQFQRYSPGNFEFNLKPIKDLNYRIVLENELLNDTSTVRKISVLKDAFPRINCEMVKDSLSPNLFYFSGRIEDDHGFSSLFAEIKHGGSKDLVYLNVDNKAMIQSFSYLVNGRDFIEEDLEVTFTVRDNDQPNGLKKSSSRAYLLKGFNPDLEEQLRGEKLESLKSDLEKSGTRGNELNKELNELRKELISERSMDWEEVEKIKEWMKEQQKLNEEIQSLNELKEEVEKISDEEVSKELSDEAKALEELMEEILDQDMIEMLEKLEELLEKMDKDGALDSMEQIQAESDELEEMLERTLELYKQLEFEYELEKTINKLEELAEKQEELSEETNDTEGKDQDGLNNEFDQLREKMKELDQMNKDLQNPNDFGQDEENAEKIDEAQDKASQNLNQGKDKKANDNQKDASDSMKEMADKMGNSLNAMRAQQNMEDLNALRELQENLLRMSFDQEDIIKSVQGAKKSDPALSQAMDQQNQLVRSSKIVKDSLIALGMRQPMLDQTINKEIRAVELSMKEAIEYSEEGRNDMTMRSQRKALTSINNLAVMLDEVINQLQQQMAQSMPSKANCMKPGQGKGSKPSMQEMKKMQQQLNKKMGEMQKQLEKGNKGKPGEKGNGMNEDLAKAAAQQAKIRSEIRRMSEELMKEGNLNDGGQLKKLAEIMEKNEEDIINKQISRETMKRQQEIMNRLLQAENAEREREMKKERESETGINKKTIEDQALEEFLRRKQEEIENLRRVPLQLNEYYKDKSGTYLQDINK